MGYRSIRRRLKSPSWAISPFTVITCSSFGADFDDGGHVLVGVIGFDDDSFAE
jgi:hypothetical protein